MSEEHDDDELIVVETETLPANAEPADEHDDDDEDERLADSQDDTDDEVISKNRKKRDKRRKLRKAAQEAAQSELARLREENNQFKQRLSAVESGVNQHNVAQVDTRLSDAQARVHASETILAKAVEAGNGEDVAAALRLRDEARDEVRALEHTKQRVAADAATPFGPQAMTMAKQWKDANPWYNPNGSDEASAITSAIDKRLLAEGFDPNSTSYWQELTSRVTARFGATSDKKKDKKKAPPMGNSREHAPTSTRKEVYVTPERKQAMMDAGHWDDPVLRNKMLKAYRDYDRNSAR